MKTSHLALAAALTGVAGMAVAADLYHPSPSQEEGMRFEPQHLNQGASRAQVRTNVMGAQRDGTLYLISRDYPATDPLVKGPILTNSREQVQSELRAWRKNPVGADGMRDLGGGP